MSEWISVKQELPEDGQKVRIARIRSPRSSVSGPIAHSYIVRATTYSKDSEFPFGGDGPSVHYWMPRPDPPAPPEEKG